MAWYRRTSKKPLFESIPARPNAIIAAATRLSDDYGFGMAIKRAGWQSEAYRQHKLSGELQYATTWMANSLSRVRLTVSEVDENGKVTNETTNQQVLDLVGDLIGNPQRVGQLFYDFGVALGLAGDSYLIEPNEHCGWKVVSVLEISDGVYPDTVDVNHGNGVEYTVPKSLVTRVHRPDPERQSEATSSVRGALPILREMEELGKYLYACINSRLAGAGILLLPSEISFPAATADLAPGETPFMATLTEAMLTPISDPSNPSAVVPIVIQAPAEMIGAAQWIVSPNAGLPDMLSGLRDKAIQRLALALDLPSEVLNGQVDASRWHTWATEESGIKISVEPLMILIVTAMTEGILKLRLDKAGIDVDKYVFWFDSTELVQRPDRSANAITLNEDGKISDAALLRETGFNDTDAPTGDELVIKELIKLITIAPTTVDALAPVLAKLLGFDLPVVAPPDGSPTTTDPSPPQPDSRPNPGQNG